MSSLFYIVIDNNNDNTYNNVTQQRKTYGKTKGEMLINGKPIDKYFNRMVGYVEQTDIHNIMQTVREAIQFSAYVRVLSLNSSRLSLKFIPFLSLVDILFQCRLPSSLSRKEKQQYAQQVIEFLGMQYISGIPLGEYHKSFLLAPNYLSFLPKGDSL